MVQADAGFIELAEDPVLRVGVVLGPAAGEEVKALLAEAGLPAWGLPQPQGRVSTPRFARSDSWMNCPGIFALGALVDDEYELAVEASALFPVRALCLINVEGQQSQPW